MNLPRDNKSSCEREVTLAPGQSLPRGSSLSRVHVNRPLLAASESLKIETGISTQKKKITPVGERVSQVGFSKTF